MTAKKGTDYGVLMRAGTESMLLQTERLKGIQDYGALMRAGTESMLLQTERLKGIQAGLQKVAGM